MTRFFYSLIVFALFFIQAPLEAKKNYQHPFAVCAIFQSEARFLKEWIEFHKLMGATRIYLYNNLSDDNYLEILRPYIATKEVVLTQWPYAATDVTDWTRIQTSAYLDAIKQAKKDKVKWLAILDTDEFLFPAIAPNMVAYLRDFEQFGGVVAHWQLFGTSDVDVVPPNKLMIEVLVRQADPAYGENAFIKSIVRPERVSSMKDPHFVEYKHPYYAVGQDFNHVKHSHSPYIIVNKLRINHYWSRDRKFFEERKMPRRQKWSEGPSGQLQRLANINLYEDYTIFRFIDALKQRMGLPQ
ncbi:MAG: glycosyltransferase family 92 protein [Parachlamydiales bacterium]|jgi:hypothetical protein